MNITYIIGVVACILVMVAGMALGKNDAGGMAISMSQLMNFVDVSSIFIVIGCTVACIVASFPIKTVAALPKHFKILLDTKSNDSQYYIDRMVEIAQKARKEGLLALESDALEEKDPFFKQAIMLIVDANDPDRVRAILENDIECMSARHDSVAAMYERGSSVAPAFGMVGTLVGLINMLKSLNLDGGGASTLGDSMSTALVTTLYGCVLAHMIFGPIANNLRARDEEEVLRKLIIVEGITCIQSGENPKFIKEKLETFVAQKMRGNAGEEGGGKGKKGKKDKGEGGEAEAKK